jgi:hypothetical protein
MFILIFAAALVEFFGAHRKVINLLQIVVAALFIFTAGLKYETGVDWRVYGELVNETYAFHQLLNDHGFTPLFERLDPVFYLMVSVIKYFGGGLQVVFFVVSAFSVFCLFSALRRYSRFALLGALLYYGLIFFYLDMSGIRQGLALNIVFLSIGNLADRKYLRYMALILLAAGIHWSALLFLPIGVLLVVPINKVMVGVLLTIAATVYFAGYGWAKSLVPWLFSVLQDTNLVDRVLIYSTSEMFAQARGLSARTVLHIIILLGGIIGLTHYYKRLNDSNRYFQVFYRLFVIQVAVFFLFYEFPELAERIKLYFYYGGGLRFLIWKRFHSGKANCNSIHSISKLPYL